MINWAGKQSDLDKKMIEKRNKEDFPFEPRHKLQKHWSTAGTLPLENEIIKHGQSYLDL